MATNMNGARQFVLAASISRYKIDLSVKNFYCSPIKDGLVGSSDPPTRAWPVRVCVCVCVCTYIFIETLKGRRVVVVVAVVPGCSSCAQAAVVSSCRPSHAAPPPPPWPCQGGDGCKTRRRATDIARSGRLPLAARKCRHNRKHWQTVADLCRCRNAII